MLALCVVCVHIMWSTDVVNTLFIHSPSAVDPTIFRIQKGSAPSVLPEGQQGTFIVRLNRQIQSDVYLDVMNVDQYTDVLNTRFLFNSTNWNLPQEMTVLGVDDNIDREDVYSSMISITTTSINPLYKFQDFVLLAVSDTDERKELHYVFHSNLLLITLEWKLPFCYAICCPLINSARVLHTLPFIVFVPPQQHIYVAACIHVSLHV